MAVRITVMRNGDQLISDLLENLDGTITMKNPLLIAMVGPGKIGLVPYLPYAKIENGVTFPKSEICLTVEPAEDMNNHYAEITGSGLVVPAGKKVETASKLKLIT